MSEFLKIAIIGRPNVGKSTLFNRLLGKRSAIIHDEPGVTRDRKILKASLGGLDFELIDTAGFEFDSRSGLKKSMVEQTTKAMQEANFIIFLTDGRAGLTPEDREIAKIIRKQNKKSALIVNKCENSGASNASEFYVLGFSNIIMISAEHGNGMSDLYDLILPYAEEIKAQNKNKQEKTQQNQIEIAIVGRPNVGKSTFINALIDEQRLITGDMPGLTRDAISVNWQFGDNQIKLTDTAGLRRKKSIDSPVEEISTWSSIEALKFAKIVVIMTTAESFGEKQDFSIIDLVVKEGRLPIIAINKWDEVKNKKEKMQEIEYIVNKNLTQIQNVPIIYISALKKQNLHILIEKAISNLDIWNKEISTSKLNEWLKHATSTHQPPMVSPKTVPYKKRLKFKYITQTNTRPPSFVIFCNLKASVPESYKAYLTRSLRETFDLDGVPIRIRLKSNENPYAK